MANEATLIYELSPAIPMTCANSVGIEKGASLMLTDPMTASGAHTLGGMVAGIAASEKIASDGKTKLGVYRGGIFKVTLSGSCTAGDPLILSSTKNHYSTTASLATYSGASVAGIALETGTTGETILMELRPVAHTGDQ